MPQRLAELMVAIRGEQDPAVRGRAAVYLLRDLARARVAAQEALDASIGELRAGGTPEEQIPALLDLPVERALHLERRP